MADSPAPFVWDIQPEVFSFSPLPRWYSLLFAAGIVGAYFILRSMLKREGKPMELLDSGLTYVVLGMMIGMRLGHVLFYQPDYYFEHPLEIPMIWKGGYASHGGFAGIVIALYLFVRTHPQLTWLWTLDRVAIGSMLSAGCIRLGNFFNSEMIGRPATGVPWAVIFKSVDDVPRHPAQLYEAVGYFAIFAVFWVIYLRTNLAAKPGRILGWVAAFGFLWRFLCEFFKEDQVPFEAGMSLNMGQLLSLPFVAIGIALGVGAIQKLGPKR